MGEAGLKGVEAYITWSHNMVVQYIVTPPSLEILMEAAQSTGSWVSKTVVGTGRDKLHEGAGGGGS